MNIQNLFALTTGQKPLPVTFANENVASKIAPQLRNEDVSETGSTGTSSTTPATTNSSTTPATQVANQVQAADATSGEEFDTFLQLLTAQIRNQDPLAPLDSTQFVEQLATFSNLELQASGNQTLDAISAQLARQTYLLENL